MLLEVKLNGVTSANPTHLAMFVEVVNVVVTVVVVGIVFAAVVVAPLLVVFSQVEVVAGSTTIQEKR